jgi:hypothetical protein
MFVEQQDWTALVRRLFAGAAVPFPLPDFVLVAKQ